jgi:hypothetical protein
MDDEDWDAEIDTSTNYTKPAVTYQQQAPSHSSYTGGSSSANRTGGFSNSIGRGRMLNSLRNDQSSSNSNHFGGGSSSGGGNGGDDYNRQSSRHNDQNNNKYDGEEKQSAFSSFSKPAVSFSSSSNSGGGFSDTVSVESRQMSAIIGKAGATINNIKDKCSVRISTPSRDEVQGQRFADIKITGNSQADIDEAKRMIKEVTDTNQNRVRHQKNCKHTVKSHLYSHGLKQKTRSKPGLNAKKLHFFIPFLAHGLYRKMPLFCI